MTLHPVILAGGIGSRLWPRSRRNHPKQLSTFFGDHSMLQSTALRAAAVQGATNPIVVCGIRHEDEVYQQLADIDCVPGQMVVEPMGRNTAPAIAAVAMTVDPDDLLLVLPADHVIGDVQAFVSSVTNSIDAAGKGMLVTFGIPPTGPATEYGYIERGPSIDPESKVHSVIKFVEKPGADLAQKYVASGDFSWNAGMFLMKASTYLSELHTSRPAIAEAVRSAVDKADTSRAGRIGLDAEAFSSCPSESIDYAVMEGTDKAAVTDLEAGWSDIGSWEAMWDLAPKDSDGNHVSGSAYLQGVSNSLIKVGDRPVAIIGLNDIVVVDTGDALLIAAKGQVQAVKTIVDRLEADGRPEV